MHNKIGQGKILFAVLTVVIVLIAILLAITNSSDKSNSYSNKYYSLILPENCTVQEDGMNHFIVSNNKKIATIQVEEDFQYGDNIEKIVANWIGMHTSIKSEEPLLTEQGDEFHKVIVKVELSAAEAINGEDSKTDEVHYFYLSEDKLFIDILVHDDEHITTVEDLITTFSLAA